MENIFIDRDKELRLLKSIRNKKHFFLVISGRRRIGKTTLILKGFPKAYYIFVYPNTTIQWLVEETCRLLNVPRFKRFIDLLEYLLDQGIVIIDEFQNFLNIDRSIYGQIQRLIDLRKAQNKPVRLVVSGSSYSLLNKVFYDTMAPLYGRRTHEIRLGHLPIKDLFNSITYNIEEFIKAWSIFEGVPYYYEILDYNKTIEQNIINLFLSRDSILIEEGRIVLSSEFSTDAKTYYTILGAIANGRTKLSEISTFFDNKVNVVVKYLEKLRKDFELVRRITPILEDPRKSKTSFYEINDNFLNFWFRFVEKNRVFIEQERYEELVDYFKNNFNNYVGKFFEKFVLRLFKDKIIKIFDFDKIGKQWGSFYDNGKKVYEIDLLALNESKKELLAVECKWKENVDPNKICKALLEKLEYVQWHNNERKEYLCIFSKSFKEKITEFDGYKVYCIDLNDIESFLKG